MKEWKPGILLNNTPLLFYSLKTLSDVCTEVVIVGGHNFDKLSKLINDFSRTYNVSIKIVENKNYTSGMFSSVKKGIENINGENIFIALSDMPLVKSGTYKSLIEFRETSEEKPDVIYPVCGDKESGTQKRGHPILINKSIKERIINETEDIILSNLLHGFKSADCVVNDEGINFDIDTEAELEEAKKIISNRNP